MVIKVAHVVGNVARAGVDQVVMNYYRAVDKEKIQFDWIVNGLDPTPLDDEIKALGGNVIHLPKYEDSLKANLKAFCHILENNNYKFIHVHMNTLSVFWLREAKGCGVPIRIAHSHSIAPSFKHSHTELQQTVAKQVLRKFSNIYATHRAACSTDAGKWLFGRSFLKRGTDFVMRNAVDTKSFGYSAEKRDKIRKQLKLKDKFVIGCIGRFVPQKNHAFLLEAFAAYRKLHPEINSHLVLVGDGDLHEQTVRLAKSLNIDKNVTFTGTVSDTTSLYSAFDVLVLPSLYEGLPATAVEAQISGLQILASSDISREANLFGDMKFLPVREGVSSATKRQLKKNLPFVLKMDKNGKLVDKIIQSWCSELRYIASKTRNVQYAERIANSGYEIKGAADEYMKWCLNLQQN